KLLIQLIISEKINSMINLIPVFFFIVALVLRFMDRSITLYREIYPQDRFVWAVPIKRLKTDYKIVDQQEIKSKIKNFLILRILHFSALLLCFLSLILVGLLKS
ncbi:MAG: hypothetical protein AAGF77_14435, partial [Bacteroidota bacterium]